MDRQTFKNLEPGIILRYHIGQHVPDYYQVERKPSWDTRDGQYVRQMTGDTFSNAGWVSADSTFVPKLEFAGTRQDIRILDGIRRALDVQLPKRQHYAMVLPNSDVHVQDMVGIVHREHHVHSAGGFVKWRENNCINDDVLTISYEKTCCGMKPGEIKKF